MRKDLFRDYKGVHIKLRKTTHAEFRKKLFDRDLTMQRAVEEFAFLVATDDKRATKILDNLSLKIVNEEINKYREPEKADIDELDHDTLYSLIEENE
jgi:hypothetical protein